MSYHFRPCVDRTACTEDGTHCRACGRSHEEIARIRQLTTELADFISTMDYDNSEAFFAYLQKKVQKKIQHAAKA